MVLKIFLSVCIDHCTENYISFSRRPERMVFRKKLHWNMIFLVFFGKIMFNFLENMILTFDQKWKVIFFKKIQRNMIFSSGLPKRRSFQKGPWWGMIFLALSGKMVFFPGKHDIFSLARKPEMTFLKKYMEIWYFRSAGMVVSKLVSRTPAKKIKEGPIARKYT